VARLILILAKIARGAIEQGSLSFTEVANFADLWVHSSFNAVKASRAIEALFLTCDMIERAGSTLGL